MARRAFGMVLVAALASCGADEEVGGPQSDAGNDAGAGGGSGGSAASGARDGAAGEAASAAVGGNGGSSSLICDPDATAPPVDGCIERTIEATPAPLDIIWIVDQSASMDQEILQVRSNINDNFASVIAQSGIDYRVIMIADNDDPNRVCVDPPLGAATCGADNPPLFYQVDQRNLSYESLQNFMNTFPSWQAYLRPGALRVIVEVTDDESLVTDTQFESWLLSGGGAGFFGTALGRRYVFHSIIGIRQTAEPSVGVISQKCNTAIGPGVNYQRLSIASGGHRTPVCATDYSPVFRAIASLVVSAGACEFALPASGVAPAAVGVEYTPGGTGTPIDWPRVASEAACGTSDGFYLDAACPPTRVLLCPQSCSTVRSDTSAKLTLRLGCR